MIIVYVEGGEKTHLKDVPRGVVIAEGDLFA